ncbi:MAG TPA: aminotransferase class V-fold PLP-dependent enzyme [Burkholderiaceae bacterium]|nr:aminotransferase class V-fold PLP-dependent enzyme [Burkholderiaceae bacterium]
MITRALILAAGRGMRIDDPETPNSLARVGGVSLLQRALRVLAQAGVREVALALGWHGQKLRDALAEEAATVRALGVTLSFFDNPTWEGPNGLSVLAARAFILERTLLVMADQIAAPALVAKLCRLPAAGDKTILCVDRDLARVFDIDDATKVKLRGNTVVAIGKQLSAADGVSAGLFVMSPTLLDALDTRATPSLTEGVQIAADRGLVEAYDVDRQLWQDVDSPEMRHHAEWLLRVYGDELASPDVAAPPTSPAADTMALVERLIAEKDQPGHVLLNPGPVMTSARVKAALVHHDVCHRDQDYSGVVRRLQDKLRPVFRATDAHDILLLTGSGTAAMEMAISSTVAPGKKLMVISNGAFGERLGEIADLHGIPKVVVRCAWGELPRPDDVARALDADPTIDAVAMIHHETSVGILNPVGAIGAICRERGVVLIADAVSALGAEDVDVVRDNVGICLSSANKCLHSVSGVSFLCVAPEVWPRVAAIPPRVYYLDMQRYHRVQRETWQTPFTPAVSAFFALETALDELAEQGGVPARRDVYRKRNLRIRRVFTDLGFTSFTNTGRESQTISTLRLPDFLTVDMLYQRVRDRGFIIYKCKASLAERHMQIANMGELSDATIDSFLTVVTDVVESARRQSPGAVTAANS